MNVIFFRSLRALTFIRLLPYMNLIDDIDAAIAASSCHDVKPIGPVTVIDQGPNRGSRVAYLRDPDGITIEFIEKA